MKQSAISLCHYPTTTLLIDDNKDFLDILRVGLADQFYCNYYDDPQKALNFLNTEYVSNSFVNRCISQQDDFVDHLTLDINIRNIHKEIYYPQRFAEISVVVIDYAMPDIDGFELCRSIKTPYIKKIILTGKAEQPLAIEAFNNGDIDKFLMKNTPELRDVLVQSICDLQTQYFMELSDNILNRLLKVSRQPLACLADPAFVKFFNNLCKEHAIIEYYIMDNQGSFLLLNRQGQPSWLAVKDEEDMENFYQHARHEQAPEKVINLLKKRTGIVYFHSDSDLQTPSAEWQKFLHPAKLLQGLKTYYYAYIDNPDMYEIQSDKIVSYQNFTNKYT